MNENLFIEAIDAMALAGMCRKISRDTARRYAAHLRAGSKLTLMLQAEGILLPGQCLLDLTEADSKTLQLVNLWKSSKNLDPKALKALNLLLQMHHIEPLNKHAAKHVDVDATILAAEEEKEENSRGPAVRSAVTMKQPVMKHMAPDRNEEPPLSLYGLLSALAQSTKYHRENPDEAAYSLLMRALLDDESYTWKNDMTETDLRIWGRRYSEHAEKILTCLRDEEGREETINRLEDALLNLEDMGETRQLREDISRACRNIERAMEDWYMLHLKQASGYRRSRALQLLRFLASMETGIGKELYHDITEHELAEKTAELFELAIEAAEGSYPPVSDVKKELRKLSSEERNLLTAAGCGMPLRRETLLKLKDKRMLRSLIEKGLLQIREKEMKLADGAEMRPLTDLADEKGNLREEDAVNLLRALLAATEAGQAESEIRQGMLVRLEELADCLQNERQQKRILEYIVKYHWENRNSHLPKEAIHSISEILKLMGKYPQQMQRILYPLLEESPWDAKLRLAMRSGVSLLEGELVSHCAGLCLEVAEKEKEAGYWTACAVNTAKKALLLLEHTGAPHLELRTWLILALGYMKLACCEAGLPEDKWPYTAGTLIRDYVVPSLKALESAEACLTALSDKALENGIDLLEAMRSACHGLLAADTDLHRFLCRFSKSFRKDCEEGLWFDLEWVEKEGLSRLMERDVFTVMHRQDRPAKLFLPWYCNTFDSTLACGPVCTQERTEASLLNILLSGQKVTLSANQLADNPYFWNLAQNPAFLWLMRRGYVTVSMFGSLNSLKEYAVTRMRNPNFHWSSLPEEFADPALREAAAKYLNGEASPGEIPEGYRDVLMRMHDAVILMDENLPASWMGYYHQSNDAWMVKRGIGQLIPLSVRVAEYYKQDRQLEHYEEMRRLNEVLAGVNPALDRSLYRKMLWSLRDQDYMKMEELGLMPQKLEAGGLDVDLLSSERKSMMEDMIRIVDDCQNRMLGERISTYQYYVYDEAASRIVPEWHAGPETDSGKLLYCQTEKTIHEDSVLLGWGQVAERITALEKLAEENPKADAERLCSRLVNQGLKEYGIFGLEESLRLKNLAFRATTGAAVGRQYSEEKGDLYQMEKNLGGRPVK